VGTIDFEGIWKGSITKDLKTKTIPNTGAIEAKKPISVSSPPLIDLFSNQLRPHNKNNRVRISSKLKSIIRLSV
jgi:hypothetical protein